MTEFLGLKRFSKDKQEQIEQLVVWCQMMGLSGRDLVSIGGKLDRINSPEHQLRQRMNEYRVKYRYTLGTGSNHWDPMATFVLNNVTFIAEGNPSKKRVANQWRVYPKGDLGMSRLHTINVDLASDSLQEFPHTWARGRCALFNLLTDIELGKFSPAVRKTPK